MAEVVLFHHALGLTNPLGRFAAALRDAGHTVHTPDLYEGRTFDTIKDGMAYSEEIGGPMAIVDRARLVVESLPSEVVYVGFSLGVLPAQSLAQTRPNARGAVLCYAALPLGQWGDNWPATWPEGVRLQLHILEGDEDFEFAQGHEQNGQRRDDGPCGADASRATAARSRPRPTQRQPPSRGMRARAA